MKILFETLIDRPLELVKDNFNEELFAYLKPPGVDVEILRFDGCHKGDEVHLALKILGKEQHWVSLITEEHDSADEWSFVDEGKKTPWPVSKWHHHHRVVKVDEKSCKIIDDIHYECSPAWIGPFAAPALWVSFAIRPYRYQKFFRNKA